MRRTLQWVERLVRVRLGTRRAGPNTSSDLGHGGISLFGDVIDVFFFQERFEEMVTPRYLAWSVVFSTVPWIL